MMVGRPVQLVVDKTPAKPGEPVLEVENLTVPSQLHKNDAVKGVSFTARRGEIVCIAGIDGNGQSELVYALTQGWKRRPAARSRSSARTSPTLPSVSARSLA